MASHVKMNDAGKIVADDGTVIAVLSENEIRFPNRRVHGGDAVPAVTAEQLSDLGVVFTAGLSARLDDIWTEITKERPPAKVEGVDELLYRVGELSEKVYELEKRAGDHDAAIESLEVSSHDHPPTPTVSTNDIVDFACPVHLVDMAAGPVSFIFRGEGSILMVVTSATANPYTFPSDTDISVSDDFAILEADTVLYQIVNTDRLRLVTALAAFGDFEI